MESKGERKKHFEDLIHVSSVMSLLNQQRASSKMCDVILRISGDELYAHSNVLAAASPYFDALFSEPDLPRSFSQKSPQIIEIHIDEERDSGYGVAVQRIVDFMYTSRIELEEDVLPQIVEIAHIMQMTHVLGFCDTFHKEVVTQSETEKKENSKEVKDDVLADTSSEHEIFEVKNGKSDVTEELTFKRHLKDKPMVVFTNKYKKRKRGRPRKERVNLNESYQGNEKANNVLVKEEQIKEPYENDESAITAFHKAKYRKINRKPALPVLNVSRSGRVIKPKVFSDGTSTKEGLLSEFDIKKEIPDQSVLIIKKELGENDDVDTGIDDDGDGDDDDDISDPSFNITKVYKEKNDLNCTVRRYACEKCDVVVSKLKDFHEHNRKHMHAEKKCSYCGWVCANEDEAEFEEHLNNHIGPKPFFCNFCSVRFKTRAQLFLHLPKHSKSKPFVCNICHAGFKWKHALKNHLITHKETKDYLCDICGFATAHKVQLKSHHLIHTGETYKCPEDGCKYQATKKSNLKFHILTHTREKPHQCEVCGTAFSLVKNMKRHMLLHQTDRPYKCSKCSFTSTRFDKLKEHFFKQHNIGEKPGKKFTWAEYLEQEENGFQTINESGNENDSILEIKDGNMETIELEITSEESENTAPQMLNLTSTTGESIPITITQIGSDISYEIPIHLIVPAEHGSAEV